MLRNTRNRESSRTSMLEGWIAPSSSGSMTSRPASIASRRLRSDRITLALLPSHVSLLEAPASPGVPNRDDRHPGRGRDDAAPQGRAGRLHPEELPDGGVAQLEPGCGPGCGCGHGCGFEYECRRPGL